MNDPIVVVAAVVVDDGRIMACRRRVGKVAAGKWEFPGGKVEPGETATQALRREIREELAAEIAVGDELLTAETVVSNRTIRLACFWARLAGPRPTASADHDSIRWLRAAELANLDWAAPDLPAVHVLAGLPEGRNPAS